MTAPTSIDFDPNLQACVPWEGPGAKTSLPRTDGRTGAAPSLRPQAPGWFAPPAPQPIRAHLTTDERTAILRRRAIDDRAKPPLVIGRVTRKSPWSKEYDVTLAALRFLGDPGAGDAD